MNTKKFGGWMITVIAATMMCVSSYSQDDVTIPPVEEVVSIEEAVELVAETANVVEANASVPVSVSVAGQDNFSVSGSYWFHEWYDIGSWAVSIVNHGPNTISTVEVNGSSTSLGANQTRVVTGSGYLHIALWGSNMNANVSVSYY
jgi:hypothetical protein